MKFKVSLEKVNKGLVEIKKSGSVTLDGSGGSFSVEGVEGRFSYNQKSEVLTIVIDDKPWLASEEMIEREILKFFNK